MFSGGVIVETAPFLATAWLISCRPRLVWNEIGVSQRHQVFERSVDRCVRVRRHRVSGTPGSGKGPAGKNIVAVLAHTADQFFNSQTGRDKAGSRVVYFHPGFIQVKDPPGAAGAIGIRFGQSGRRARYVRSPGVRPVDPGRTNQFILGNPAGLGTG